MCVLKTNRFYNYLLWFRCCRIWKWSFLVWDHLSCWSRKLFWYIKIFHFIQKALIACHFPILNRHWFHNICQYFLLKIRYVTSRNWAKWLFSKSVLSITFLKYFLAEWDGHDVSRSRRRDFFVPCAQRISLRWFGHLLDHRAQVVYEYSMVFILLYSFLLFRF